MGAFTSSPLGNPSALFFKSGHTPDYIYMMELQLEDVFCKYGRLRNVWIARRPPGFAFIHYEDIRDAEDAVRALDGMLVTVSVTFVEKVAVVI